MGLPSWSPPRDIVTEEWLLTDLRAEVASDVAATERSYFDRLSGDSNRPLVLFGAGNLGQRTLVGLRRVGVEPLAFVDNDPKLHGSEIDGLPVLRPDEAATRYGTTAAFVVTIWTPVGRLAFPTVDAQMRALGCTTIVPFVPLFWKYAEEFLPNFCLDLPHLLYGDAERVRAAYGLLPDANSRYEFRAQLSYLLSAQDYVEVLGKPDGEWYFPRELVTLSGRDVFIDCGAYDGDTISSFLGACTSRFDSIVAFEPDPAALARLTEYVGGLGVDVRTRIRIEAKAVADREGWLFFDGGGTPGSKLAEDGSLAVEAVRLDGELVGMTPTIIKMDIEGAEEAALLGGRHTIERYRPILAICIYHLQRHLYDVPLLMARLCPRYGFAIRRQGPDGDLVCFAVPDERAIGGDGGHNDQ